MLTGGPGTGKTTTVAALLALLAEQAATAGEPPLRIALAAPTGKAAARLQQAVREEVERLDDVDQERLTGLQSVTLHRLLGSRPDSSTRFRHHRDNRLPHDVVVVDETSMVSLTMMARLLEAVRPESRLILVGDPDQLTSVEAGAVLADLVDGLGSRADTRIAALSTSHRFGESIRALAAAVRAGDADEVVRLLRVGGEHVALLEDDDPGPALREVLLPRALDLRAAAEAGDDAEALRLLDAHRLLCAHRDGSRGVHHWNRLVERWTSEETGVGIWSAWYPGRPVLVTANDYGLGLYNGDTGVAVRRGGGLRAVLEATAGPVELAPEPARRGRDDARDDHPQEPGQPGRRGHRADAPGGLPAAHPRALLHRDHPGPEPGARRRHRGGDPGRRRASRRPRDRAARRRLREADLAHRRPGRHAGPRCTVPCVTSATSPGDDGEETRTCCPTGRSPTPRP